MSTVGRFALGAVGGLLPVLASLVALDLASFASLIDDHKLTEGLCIGYAIRVIGLVALGGAMACLNREIESPLALAQIGIAAPALVTALLSGPPAKSDHKVSSLFISHAYAAPSLKVQISGNVVLAAFFEDLIDGIKPGLNMGRALDQANHKIAKPPDSIAGAAITNTATGDCWVLPIKSSLDTIRADFPLPEYDVQSGVCPTNVGSTSGKAGFIFIGNEQEGAKNVNLSYLAKDSGEPVPFDQLVVGQTYTVTKNLYLRGGQPLNNAGYFSDQPNLGLIKVGSKVILDSIPVPLDRPTLKQAWARVQVPAP